MRDYIYRRLTELNFPTYELNRYDEPHRFYHNLSHIESMIQQALNENILTNELFLAIVFHDIIYEPGAPDNEQRSADLLFKYLPDDNIRQAILSTQDHRPGDELSRNLCRLDLQVLDNGFPRFVEFERKIFKEYQFVDYKDYLSSRPAVLYKFKVKMEYLEYVETYQPNIAVYAGSFDPFHIGHLNILQKAEKIFDKVIIARGVNPTKRHPMMSKRILKASPDDSPLPDVLRYHQKDTYDGLLTDYIKSLGYPVTLLRGLRNATDLQYETTQYRFLQDLMPDIKMVSIICDREYEHISSSAIRQLQTYGEGYNYLPKKLKKNTSNDK